MDFAVLVGFGNEEQQIKKILDVVSPRIPDAVQFAVQNRTLLALADGVPADIALAAFDYEERMIERSRTYQFMPETNLRICSPEDLVISKVFSGRTRDLEDVEGVLARRANDLDWSLIERELMPLLAAVDGNDRLDWLLERR